MVFQHSAGRKILTLGEGFTTQVVTLWCFNTVVEPKKQRLTRAPHAIVQD
jgi:hypothetical protein